MDGLEAMHDDNAAARGWSPQQLHRLNSYLLGGVADGADGGGYAKALGGEPGARCHIPLKRCQSIHVLTRCSGVSKHALLAATPDGHDVQALGTATANDGSKAPSTEEGGRKRSSRCGKALRLATAVELSFAADPQVSWRD